MQQGELFYVIGPSGSGKDSLMEYARQQCSGRQVIFAHRYITRPADAGGENHVHVREEEFQARLDRGLFALHWNSHGFRYGIGVEIDLWMQAGFHVVVNGSRGYLAQATQHYANIRPVLITVDRNILKQRLVDRGRESRAEIEKRLERATAYKTDHPNQIKINNSGSLAQAGEKLCVLLRQA